MRKITLLALLVALLMTLTSIAAPPLKMSPAKTGGFESFAGIDNVSYIDANNIFMFVTNHGNFGRDLAGVFGNDYGTYFPYNSITEIESGALSNSPLYASGMWIGGRNSATDSVQIVTAEYSDEYVPGPMVGGTFLPDDPSFRVYKLYRDSMTSNPNQDWLEFPHGKTNQEGDVNPDHGAPWTVDETSGDTIPDMIGDQMLWAVYNDADPVQHDNDNGETEPMGIEVRQTTFAYDRVGPLGNIIFLRLRAVNKGTNTFDSLYFSLWADPDLGGSGDDFVACDPELSLGFIYNATNRDQQYGSAPPALGYDFFQAPMRARTDADTTDNGEPIYGRMWGQIYTDSVNIGMVSFNRYINGTDPDNKDETYNYMRGLNRDGTDYTYNGQPTTFFNNSDPVAGTGDLDVAPADRRFMLSTGPVTFAPGDSTEILAAIIVGQGSDRLSSISVMKYYDVFAQLAYESDFAIPVPPVAPRVTVRELDASISLVWTDTSEVDPGDYPFEGYTVYQGESFSGPWRKLDNFDLNNGIGTIFDLVIDPQTGALETRAVKLGIDAGAIRHFVATEDFIGGGPLRNLTTYYYKVEAYSYDANGQPKTLTSETIVSCTPQFPVAGTEYGFAFQDTIPVVHTTGISDGAVYPFVVDPTVFNGHTYQVVFEDTLGIVIDTIVTEDPDAGLVTTYDSTNIAWHLDDVTADTRLLEWQPNQTGDVNYIIVDGMLVVVVGPAADGVKHDDQFSTSDASLWGWDIPAGTRRFTWAGGANTPGFEGFQGAIGWESPYHFFGDGDKSVLATETKDVLLLLATVDADGVFDAVNDTNVSYAYRYGRTFQAAAARPEFAPYIITATNYAFQDYTKSVPLSAWDVESDPPRRLALGYLENNVYWGLVDGKWWPPYNAADTLSGDYDYWGNNYDGAGPREWLFILDEDYSETPDPDYTTTLRSFDVRCMYLCTMSRRADVAWSPDATGQDQFIIHDTERNLPTDTFTFVATAPIVETSGEDNLERINVVPNPYYLNGPYDPTPGNTQVRFQHLPANCTISIYNLAGDLIDKIEKEDASTSIATWDIKSSNNLPLASGIYIYVVDAPGFGSKVGKMAIFTEVEVLKIY